MCWCKCAEIVQKFGCTQLEITFWEWKLVCKEVKDYNNHAIIVIV